MKNTTNEDIIVVNMLIPANGEINVEANMWAKLIGYDPLLMMVENETIIMNDGKVDLNVTAGIKLINTFQEIDFSAGGFPYRRIKAGVIVTIPEEYQMPVYQELKIDNSGELVVYGELVVR
jgi:hypothetical protein